MPRKKPCSLAFASALRYVSFDPALPRPRLGRALTHCFSVRSPKRLFSAKSQATKSASVFRPNRDATSASCSCSLSASRFTFGILHRADSENIAGYWFLSAFAAPSSAHFISGLTTPGMSMNRMGCAALISVNRAAALSSLTSGNTSTNTSVFFSIVPFASKISNAPTRCWPSKMLTARVWAPKNSANAFCSFVPFFVLAVPSAREMTPGTANLSAALRFAMVTARSPRKARCCSYTLTFVLSAKRPAGMA
mmetsp:Transcript_4134/g.17532  ORF Transcript_4134/g.17532 Transcript_4134/m.17532 type:complete len:251 (-) Transcript_4134:290-1042(-)